MTKKILIIDDDNDLQEVFPLMFEGQNYELRAALNIENIEGIIVISSYWIFGLIR